MNDVCMYVCIYIYICDYVCVCKNHNISIYVKYIHLHECLYVSMCLCMPI